MAELEKLGQKYRVALRCIWLQLGLIACYCLFAYLLIYFDAYVVSVLLVLRYGAVNMVSRI